MGLRKQVLSCVNSSRGCTRIVACRPSPTELVRSSRVGLTGLTWLDLHTHDSQRQVCEGHLFGVREHRVHQDR